MDTTHSPPYSRLGRCTRTLFMHVRTQVYVHAKGEIESFTEILGMLANNKRINPYSTVFENIQ